MELYLIFLTILLVDKNKSLKKTTRNCGLFFFNNIEKIEFYLHLYRSKPTVFDLASNENQPRYPDRHK